MKHAAAKDGGNQGRMAGRRRAVGFLHIVPGVFPTGVYTDRLHFHRFLRRRLFENPVFGHNVITRQQQMRTCSSVG